ncbi:MAG TPA: class IV adenylate cyclase [Burkholderiaceae bacterium]|jgi:adenylate cyclase class IV|nr:class IV adenylate cyclase [Burkholderiaceae bacterium]
MARNIEIKARCADLTLARQHACALTGNAAELIVQDDTFFACASGRLKLRVLGDGSGELIHYHRANEAGPKASHYVIVPCPDPDALRDALARACGVIGRVRKQRWLVMCGRTRIHFDQVEGLGNFIELEVVLAEDEPEAAGVAQAQALIAALRIPPADLLTGAYLDLMSDRPDTDAQ